MEREGQDVRREAEGAEPGMSEQRPQSIGADSTSSSMSTQKMQSTQHTRSTLSLGSCTSAWDSTTLSQGMLLDSTNQSMSLSQYPLSETDYSISQFPIQESSSSERLEPLGLEHSRTDRKHSANDSANEQWFALQDDGVSPVKRPLDSLAHNLSQGVVELAMMELSQEEDVKDSVGRHVSEVSSNLVEGTLTLSQHPLLVAPADTSLSSQGTQADSKLSLQTLGSNISQHTINSADASEFSTTSSSVNSEIARIQGLIPPPGGMNTTKDSVVNKFSSTADQTMQFQPDMHSMNIGDSYLEKRPVSSSTPSASKLGDLSAKDTSAEGGSFIQSVASNKPAAGSGKEESVTDSVHETLTVRDQDPKEPGSLIQQAGVEYMTADERASLVTAPPPADPVMSKAEREEIFSDIFRAPPPGELNRSRSGSQKSLAGSEKSAKSDKRSTISEPEVNRKYNSGDLMSVVTPGVSHIGDSTRHSTRFETASLNSTSSRHSNDGSEKSSNVQKEKSEPNLIDQLSISRVTESLESFDCVSTTSHQSADRHSNRSAQSQKSQKLETHKEEEPAARSNVPKDQASKSSSSTTEETTREARLLESERLAIGGFERTPSAEQDQQLADTDRGKTTNEPVSGAKSSSSSLHSSTRKSTQSSTSQKTALEQLAITTVPTGPSEQMTNILPASGIIREPSIVSDADDATSIWSQSVTGEDRSDPLSARSESGPLSARSESGPLSARSLTSQASLRSHQSGISQPPVLQANLTQETGATKIETNSPHRPSSAHSSHHSVKSAEDTASMPRSASPVVLSRPESITSRGGEDAEEDRQSICSNLTERVATLLAKPTQDGLTLVQVTTSADDSRPLSQASVETLKENPLEDAEITVAVFPERRNLESPFSQFSDTSTTSYQDLPNSLNPQVVATRPREAVIAETSFEHRYHQQHQQGEEEDAPPSRCSTAARSDDTLDPEVKKILKKYDLMSDTDLSEPGECRSQRLTPTGSIAESDDTTLTHRVNRLLHSASELDKSYLYEDPARSVTLCTVSGSTTRTNTPPPTLNHLNQFSKSSESLPRIPVDSCSSSRPRSRESHHSQTSEHIRPMVEDSLRHHVLTSDSSAGPASISSGRSSRTSSVNYDVLQHDLEDIQRGLAILQSGDLAIDPGSASSTGSRSRRMSDASEGAASKVTGSEIGTPRKFSWDYGDLNAEALSADFRFVTSRSDLQAHSEDKTKRQRQEPDGVSRSTHTVGAAHSKGFLSNSQTENNPTLPATEGKYTRIARELDEETSPQRRSKYPIDSGPSTWSAGGSRRYDFLGRSYESLTRSTKTADFVPIAANKSSSLDDSNSFSQKVNDLMERESPQRQAYRFLAEAEDSMRLMEAKRSSRLHASDTDLHNSSSHNISSTSSSFQFTPIPKRSFQAFGNVQSFLTTQLTKMSSAQFDTSVELRSPVKNHLNRQIIATAAPRPSALKDSLSDPLRSLDKAREDPVSGHLRSGDHSTDSLKDLPAGNRKSPILANTRDLGYKQDITKRPTHSEPLSKADSVRVEVDSRMSDSMSDYVPLSRPVTMQDYVSGTYRSGLNERQRERERSQHELADRSSIKDAYNKEKSATVDTRQRTPDLLHQAASTPLPDAIEDQLTPRSDGSVDSVVESASAPRSARSDHSAKSDRSDRRSASNNSNLRPYRPPGSTDLYYVESGTDDGNASVANSETTIESTHIGSDDARAPHFPNHWLGSRTDPAATNGTGIYSSLKSTNPQLDPIVENKSFEEPKHAHDQDASLDKTLVEDEGDSFIGKNRSHHNNSGQHEVSDTSTASEDQTAAAAGSAQPQGQVQTGRGEDNMRFLTEDLEGGRWEKYNKADTHTGRHSQDMASRYADIPIARSERYRSDIGRYPNDITPDYYHHQYRGRSDPPGVFGTPQRHISDRSYEAGTSAPRRRDDDHRQGRDLHGLDDASPSLQESYRHYAADNRERYHQFDTTEDEISSRLRLYPDEEIHTMEETPDRSRDGFTPLRHDKDDDEVHNVNTRGNIRETSPKPFSSSRTSPLRTSSSRASPNRGRSPTSTTSPSHGRYHVSDQSPDRQKSRYRSPPPMNVPRSAPNSGSPNRHSAQSASPDVAHGSSSPTQRIHMREPQESDQVHTRRDYTGREPRQAWSETTAVASGGVLRHPEGNTRDRHVEDKHVARSDQYESDKYHQDTNRYQDMKTTGGEKDVNALWEKFQRRYTDSSSDGEGGSVKEVDLRKLSSLIKNPVQHVTQDLRDLAGQPRSAGRSPERVPRSRDEQYYDATLDDEAPRTSRGSSRPASHRAANSAPLSEQSSLGHGQSQVTFNTETPVSDQTPKSTVPSRRDEATLQSIPEDTTLDSLSTDVTSSDSNGTMSLIQRLPDDPKLLKLQTKIQRQRQKYEMEKVREQRRRQKIHKLETMLAAKQSVDSIGMDEYHHHHHHHQEYMEPHRHREAAREHGFTRPVYESDNRSSRHSTAPIPSETISPSTRPMSTASGKSTSTPSSTKGTSGEDMSFAVSEITSMSATTRGTTAHLDESSSTLVDEGSSKGYTTTTTQEETTPQQSEVETNTRYCACCHKKKAKSKSKSHKGTSNRSKSPPKVMPSRSKSPSKVRSRSKSPEKAMKTSSKKSHHHVSHSPLKHKSARSPSPTGNGHHGGRSQSPISKRSRRHQEDENRHVHMEKPLKEQHNRHASYLEFDKPKRADNRDRKSERRKAGQPDRRSGAAMREASSQARERTYDAGEHRSKEKRERQKENKERSHQRNQWQEEEEAAKGRREESPEHDDRPDSENEKGTPKQRTIGVNVPTPICLSPPTRRKVRDVTMVSEAVQTTPQVEKTVEKESRHASPSRHHTNHGAFTPESSLETSENVQPRDKEHPKVAASRVGMAWYIPMKESRPWRQPLRERQAHAVSMETWPPRHEAWRAGYDLGSSWEPGKVPVATAASDAEIYLTRARQLQVQQAQQELRPKLSLQEAFERRKQDFISVSRERQKHLALKSEERHIQDLHSRQRAELFRVDRKLDPNKNAHPYSENLYQPKKRVITKKEMKELTNKKYANLEEVVKKGERERRAEEYRTNRVRAQHYKYKILSKVLHKKAAWVE